jgi:5'-3' exonuclease
VKLLVDADTPCYAAAIVHEADDVEYAIMEANASIQRLLNDTNSTSFAIYLSGEGNFRHDIFPEYKANRIKVPKPRHLQEVRDSVARGWDAIISKGCEADDLLGITQCNSKDTCIASIDKDLDQIPGMHYNPGILRKGKWIKEPRMYEISPAQGLYYFYYQLLIGDSTDNIKGAIGIGPKKAENILFDCKTPWEYYQAVAPFFSCKEELLQNARCVYIWQKENDLWLPPVDPSEKAQLHSECVENGDKTMAP